MNLDEYLKINNCNVIEGYTAQVPEQVKILKQISENNNIKNILEIGFNAGHSSCLFLESNNNCNVLSFDIGLHDYFKIGFEYIIKNFNSRHFLIIGNSNITVPLYYKFNPMIKYDLIFIDGGHDYELHTMI